MSVLVLIAHAGSGGGLVFLARVCVYVCGRRHSYVAMQQRAVMSVCHSFRKQPQVKCSLIFYPFLFDRRWGHKNSLVLMARVLKRQPQQGRGFDRRETEQHLKMLPCWIVKLVSLWHWQHYKEVQRVSIYISECRRSGRVMITFCGCRVFSSKGFLKIRFFFSGKCLFNK